MSAIKLKWSAFASASVLTAIGARDFKKYQDYSTNYSEQVADSIRPFTSENSEFTTKSQKTHPFNAYFLEKSGTRLIKSYRPAWWHFNPHAAMGIQNLYMT